MASGYRGPCLSILGGAWLLTTTSASTFLPGGAAACSTAPPSTRHGYRPSPTLYKPLPPGYQLKQVVVIVRHGDRAPITRTVGSVIKDSPEEQAYWIKRLPPGETVARLSQIFPVSPKLETLDHGEYPYGQLTIKGADELRSLGRHLRERYMSTFLPPSIDANQPAIYCRCTNIRRTHQSAQNFLHGLFPHATEPGALTIHTRPSHEETLYPDADGQCLRQEEIIVDLRKRMYDLKAAEQGGYKSLLKESREKLGYPTESYVPWNQVREVLTCWLVHGKPLMSPVDEAYVERVVQWTGLMWGQWFQSEEMIRLGFGRFLHELLDQIGRGLRSTHPHKMLVFVGHDSTIVPALAALGVYDNVWPVYASNIVLEVVEALSTGRHYVRCFYDDREVEMQVGPRRRYRGRLMPWEEFSEGLGGFIPTDYMSECLCRSHDPTQSHPFTKKEASSVSETIVGTNIKPK